MFPKLRGLSLLTLLACSFVVAADATWNSNEWTGWSSKGSQGYDKGSYRSGKGWQKGKPFSSSSSSFSFERGFLAGQQVAQSQSEGPERRRRRRHRRHTAGDNSDTTTPETTPEKPNHKMKKMKEELHELRSFRDQMKKAEEEQAKAQQLKDLEAKMMERLQLATGSSARAAASVTPVSVTEGKNHELQPLQKRLSRKLFQDFDAEFNPQSWDDIVSMTESLTGKQTSDFLHKENLGVPRGLKDRTAAVLSFVRDELGMSPPSLWISSHGLSVALPTRVTGSLAICAFVAGFLFASILSLASKTSLLPWPISDACEYISALYILSRDTAGIGGLLEMTGLQATPVAKMSLSFISTCGVSLLCRFLSSRGILPSFSLPFLSLNVSQWILTLVLNALVEFIKLNARTVAHFDSVSVHQALRFDIYIHVYFLRNFWSRLCQVGLTWPWECRHQAGLKTYAPARTWRRSIPPAWKEACFRLQAFHPGFRQISRSVSNFQVFQVSHQISRFPSNFQVSVKFPGFRQISRFPSNFQVSVRFPGFR